MARNLPTAAAAAVPMDGWAFGSDLPQRPIGLAELRSLMLSAAIDANTKDAVWRELVARSRGTEEEIWIVVAVGMLLPGLRKAARRLARGMKDPHDLEAEIVLGFLEGQRTVDPQSPQLASQLWWWAHRRGTSARDRLLATGFPTTEGVLNASDVDLFSSEAGTQTWCWVARWQTVHSMRTRPT